MKKEVRRKENEQQIEIKLINIQGLSKHKVIEIENLVKHQTLLCLTEIQRKIDKIKWNKDYTIYSSMRRKEDKKGGGLMIIHKNDQNFDMQQEQGNNKDLLILRGKFKN